MDWTTDNDNSSKKSSKTMGDKNYLQQLIPRLGRRAGQNNLQEDNTKFDDDFLEGSGVSSGASTRSRPFAPPRARKTGWGDELKSAKMRSANLLETEIRRRSSEEDDDIPVIPDIDEIQEDNMTSPDLANAPSVGINRVAAYKELDSDLLKNSSFAMIDDINLSLLTEKLYPDKLLDEPDEVWSWDQLFIQVSSELNSELIN
ncbi:hypothetical protein HCN44_000138 [Aphidius gifuensis]|uniref:Intraflagellar transport protein 43 homolog n=1 Tax=Aphidius gifuensis TaxID=684658 RepID=A0A835CQL9_APHGI|nr:intraflagellar transport protein 43 homolog [Aphidius gifuensis]KAF7990333.1 hypothetical protein HCN44_000138 [Aphidius gifuensis]